MTRNSRLAAATRAGRLPRRTVVVASSTIAAVALSLTVAGTAVAGPAPVETRAALDPAIVAGRGAAVNFVEQEAENAATNGTVIGPSRDAYTLPSEASGRKA